MCQYNSVIALDLVEFHNLFDILQALPMYIVEKTS